MLLASLALPGCATQPIATDKGCEWTRPITELSVHKRDTELTQRIGVQVAAEIRAHNAARAAACNSQPTGTT